jgi:acyl-CoA synthetase (AMP-forming)/AMP-acid ligase II
VAFESYVHGNCGAPLIGSTIGAFLEAVAATDGARDALVVPHQRIRWSYAELLARSDAFAAGLLSLGLEPGDRVGVWAPNCAEWTVAQFATARAGLILVTINPAYRVTELGHVLRTVECRALVTATHFRTSDYLSMLRELAPELDAGFDELASARLPALRRVVTIGEGAHAGCIPFPAVAARATQAMHDRLRSIAAAIQIDDAVNIQFTSGTTGLPKGATLSHHNLLNNGFFVGAATGIEPGSRVCIPVPLYHCFGMVMGNLGCLTHAAAMVYSVMLGYWNDDVRTREAIDRAGWMHTGDLAAIDNDGYCRIVGRIKDMVIRGGENVYPREIEEFLYGHPDVQDVQVIGVPDAKYGEEICAWIVRRRDAALDEDGVRAFCRDRIAHYKIPRYVKFVDGFPSTVTGKVQKFAMRQAMIEEFERAK